jgi:LacI family transcriptional regulator
MILQSANNIDTESANLKLCKLNRVAGILVALSDGTTDFSAFRRIEESGIPVVFFDKVPETPEFTSVCVADADAGTMAAEAIIAKKRQNILAIFGSPTLSITRKRLKSFTGTFKKSAPETRLTVLHTVNSTEAYEQTLSQLKKKDRPDTIFCMSDEILTGSIKAIQHQDLSIPKDIALIAISNGFIPTLFNPEITYVETSGIELGKKAFESMLQIIMHDAVQPEVVIPARLIEGGSL